MNNIKPPALPPLSYWLDSTPQTNFPELNQNIEVDIAVVGGGMAGILCASLLKDAGYKVAVLESDRILQGTTGHTTAKLTSQHNIIYNKLIQQVGREQAKQYAEANESAIKFIANNIEEKNIDCDFSWQKAYVYTNSEQYIEQIQDEVRAACNLGINASYLEEIPLPFKVKAAISFDRQAQFHPRKYLLTLAQEIFDSNNHIFENTRAVSISENGNRYTVNSNNNISVTASKVIIASHYPFYDTPGLYFTRLYPERSYIIAVEVTETFPGGMYINAEEPARSLRSLNAGEKQLVLVVGENHKTGHGGSTSQHYDNLFRFANDIFTVNNLSYKWSTQDCMSIDSVPFIGQLTSSTPNLYVATGFNKWGMTSSTAAALIISDLIIKGESPWSQVFNPSRFRAAGAKNFIVENSKVAKDFLGGKLLSVPNNIKIAKNHGQVIEINGERVGAYRDENDELHLVDTTCTHLGCELVWNDAEKTWDCPCHGSRFNCNGGIVEGPAYKPLPSTKQS